MTSSAFLQLPVTLTGSTNPRLYPMLGVQSPTWRWDGMDLTTGAVSSWASSSGAPLTLQSGSAPVVAGGGVKYVSWSGAQGALALAALGNDAVKSLLMIVRMNAVTPAGGLFNGGAVLLNTQTSLITMYHAGQTGTNPAVASTLGVWQVIVATIPAGTPAAGSKLWVNGTVSTQTSNTTSASKISQLMFGGSTTNMDVAGIAAWDTKISDADAAGAYNVIKTSYAGLGWA